MQHIGLVIMKHGIFAPHALMLALIVLSQAACNNKSADKPSISLVGEWECRKGFDPAWLESYDPKDWRKIRVPVVMETLPGFEDFNRGQTVTIRRSLPKEIIALLDKKEPVAFRSGTISDVSRFYFNAVRFGRLGSIEPYRPGAERECIEFLPLSAYKSGGTNALFVVISTRGNFVNNGITGHDIQIGGAKYIFGAYNRSAVISFVLITVYLLVGAYHLLLGVRRPKDLYNIYLGLFCVFYSTFLIANGEGRELIIGDNVYFRVKLDQISAKLAYAAIGLFVTYFFRRKHTKIMVAIAAPLMLLAAIDLFAPLRMIDYTFLIAQPFMILIIIVSSYETIRMVVKKNPDAIFLAAGLAILFLGAINDLLIENGILLNGFRILNYVFVGFVFGIDIVLANRFMKVYNEVEELNVTLENKVRQRTGELQIAMEEMEAINTELTDTRDALWGEMELAKKIQTVLLPMDPAISGYRIAACMAPAAEVGGDYYDIINAGGMDWIVIGDVSGHGVSAGLIMMMTKTAIQTVIHENPSRNPSEILSIINRPLMDNIRNIGDPLYVTMTVLAAHKNGAFAFSGLHQDIMIFRAANGTVELVETRGTWIGIMNSVSGMMNDDRLAIDIGDCILLYTDGITEAWRKGSIIDQRKPEEEMYGAPRLKERFGAVGGREPEEIKTEILKSLDDYDCKDDVTLLVIKRTE